MEELRKEGNETGTPEEGQEIQQVEGEDAAAEEGLAEAEEGVADDDDDDDSDDDKLSSTKEASQKHTYDMSSFANENILN